MNSRVRAAWTTNWLMYESSIIQVLSSIFVLFAYLILIFVSYVFITNSTPYIAVFTGQHHLEFVGVTLFWAAIVAWNLTLRKKSKLDQSYLETVEITGFEVLPDDMQFWRFSGDRNCKNTVISRRIMIQLRYARNSIQKQVWRVWYSTRLSWPVILAMTKISDLRYDI